jgi:hypothetical protein
MQSAVCYRNDKLKRRGKPYEYEWSRWRQTILKLRGCSGVRLRNVREDERI